MDDIKDKTLNFLELNRGSRFKQKEIAKAIGVAGNEYVRFKRLLYSLSKSGKIRKYPKSRYAAKESEKYFEGALSVTMKGFGFVIVEDGLDIFISSDAMQGALSGDKVKVEVFPHRFGPNPEGRIVDVIERKRTEIVGTLRKLRGKWFVTPDERMLKNNLPVIYGKEGGGKSGQKIVAKLVEGDSYLDSSKVEVTRIIGYPDDPGTDFESVCALFGLNPKFPKSVEKESASLREGLDKKEQKNRLDLRNLTCFTIDPVEAKDFDDAVSIETLDNGNYLLGVHIADVSHYVREGSVLDREALKRGTSVYMIDHVVPMLPERISNELCSLKPNEERYTFSVLLTLSREGDVLEHKITPSVIKSKRRFTYREVQKILNKGKGDYSKEIKLMNRLAKSLYEKRKSVGSIDFDLSEAIFRLDENGMPYDVFRSERLDSHRLIEEFMLLANKTVAQHIAVKRSAEKLPFLYRVHPKPKKEEIDNFLEMLKFLGVKVKVPVPIKPEDFRDIMEIVEKMPEKDLLEKIALRSMSKAVYSEKNEGHFALAFKHYSHFTSPIRRYPDLVIHRLLKEYLNRSTVKGTASKRKRLSIIAKSNTESEINALSAERAHARIKEVKFLSGKVGEEFDGSISGVIGAGLFVELVEFPIEGFVPVKLFTDDYYIFEPDRHRFIGKRNKRTYMLGDRLRIRVKSVKVAEREVEFSPIGDGHGRK